MTKEEIAFVFETKKKVELAQKTLLARIGGAEPIISQPAPPAIPAIVDPSLPSNIIYVDFKNRKKI